MNFHIDFHVHTNRSPDGRASLETLAAAAKVRGLDAIAIADHDLFTVPAPVKVSGVWVLPACECSTQQGHLLGLLPEREPDCAALRANGLPSAADAAAELRRCGALVVLAHPFGRPSVDFGTLGFVPDLVETANPRAYLRNPEANRQAAAYAAEHRLPTVGGSDAHSHCELGNAYTVIDCPELTPDALRAALRSGQGTPVLKRNTPPICKGLSQFCMARRSKNPRRICRGLAYLAYCVLRGIFSKR